MSIDFSPERWDRLRETYRLWWAGELDRPVVPIELAGRDPGRPRPHVPLLTQATCHRLDIPAEALIDRMDYELSSWHYLGDAYPRVNFDAFGPVVIAAMLGARLENTSGQVGPDMFDEFAAPELKATCAKLPYSFYHLDGVDALVHLRSVLAIDDLDGVQWVPGAGRPGCAYWPEVYRRIRAAGKKIQVVDGDLAGLDAVIHQIGTSRGVHQFLIRAAAEEGPLLRGKLREYGIE